MTELRRKPPQEPAKTVPYWPYCETCHQPYGFDPEEPFADCACGTSEWGYPRPAPWVPNPRTRGWTAEGGQWAVLFKRDADPWEVVTGSENATRKYYEMLRTNWSEVLLVRVESYAGGPLSNTSGQP